MKRLAALTLGLGFLATAAPLLAQEGSGAAAQAEEAPKAPSPTSSSEPSGSAAPSGSAVPSGSAAVVPKDPAGVQGISPATEAIVRGDAAFIARDYSAAKIEYTEAVKASPKDPVAHLRLAQTFLVVGEVTEAQESIVTALRFVGARQQYKAQAFFLLAALREVQGLHDDAIDSWGAYAALATEAVEATAEQGLTPEQSAKAPRTLKIYTETAEERKSMIAKHKKLQADYASVKTRIEKRLAEAEASALGKK